MHGFSNKKEKASVISAVSNYIGFKRLTVRHPCLIRQVATGLTKTFVPNVSHEIIDLKNLEACTGYWPGYYGIMAQQFRLNIHLFNFEDLIFRINKFSMKISIGNASLKSSY